MHTLPVTVLGNLFGTINEPQYLAPSAGPVCVHKESDCTPRAALGPGEGQLQSRSSQRSTSVCRLSVRLKEFKSSSSTPQQQDLITTGWGRVSHVGGAIASPQADHLEASTLPEKDVSRSTGNDLAQGTWQLFLQFSLQSYQPQSLLTHP